MLIACKVKKLIFTSTDMSNTAYIVQSPILFMVFNRPDLTRKVFQQIKTVKPLRLYISADGPRKENASDLKRCTEVKEIVSEIDWPCTVYHLYPVENKGCRIAVSSAIDWFFQQEEEGIILEDDCLPSLSFFSFCDQMLEKYRRNKHVFSITGSNAQDGIQRGHASYYFSQLSNIWGWASWRRAWNYYERDLPSYTEKQALEFLQKNFQDPLLVDVWMDLFIRVKKGLTDTWDQQFQFITFFHDGLCVTPNSNLISNIGFGPDATHTFDLHHINAKRPLTTLDRIEHPIHMISDKDADYYLFNHEFKLDEKRQTLLKDKRMHRRVKKWFRNLITKSSGR